MMPTFLSQQSIHLTLMTPTKPIPDSACPGSQTLMTSSLIMHQSFTRDEAEIGLLLSRLRKSIPEIYFQGPKSMVKTNVYHRIILRNWECFKKLTWRTSYMYIPSPYFLKLNLSLCAYYSGWMSCLISFVLASPICEEWEECEKFQNENMYVFTRNLTSHSNPSLFKLAL